MVPLCVTLHMLRFSKWLANQCALKLARSMLILGYEALA